MIEMLFFVLAFAVLHLIKGGKHFWLAPQLEHKAVFKHIFGARTLSTLLSIPLCILAGLPEWQALLFAVAWWASMFPSLGEEIGAIGGLRGNWPDTDYKEEDYAIFNFKGGMKKGLQRGAYTGSILSLAAWNPLLVIAGLLWPVTVYLGVSAGQLIEDKTDSEIGWAIYEGLFGAVLGLFFYLIIYT